MVNPDPNFPSRIRIFSIPDPESTSKNLSLNDQFKSKTTKLILLDSLLQEVEATLPHLVLQKDKE
jgi:hypothetical protein